MKTRVLVLLGPTASGKTALAVELAKKLNGEIVSADSRQIYRGLDIGTGKDLGEYGEVPYHLIDNHEVGDPYSVAHFQTEAVEAIQIISQRGKLPILCGGTGLY
ncbi:MAG: tRNA dimethylallyltransferase, partial [Bacteroidota bacterium]